MEQMLLETSQATKALDLSELPEQVSGEMRFAIVLYMSGLKLFNPLGFPRQSLGFLLDEHLFKQDQQLLKQAHGFLYYLMTGLSRLPSWPQPYLYRGVGAESREAYVSGRTCFWPGLCFATSNASQARLSAGPAGVILRIRVLQEGSHSRDLRSICRHTDAILLPNFKTQVLQEAKFDSTIGLEVVEFVEPQQAAL
ncbi:unnamed protein product [Durusdinium trenchii]|uniref:Uncharacterized protein n=2 Tax=Durusdinium trenchii TaxID=1381693 RepID=A0ABP0IJ67_9DINO